MHQDAHEHTHTHGPGGTGDSGHDHDHSHPHLFALVRRDGAASFMRAVWLCIAIAAVGLLAASCCFFVDETQYVYVTDFGKPVRLCVEPGLEFKMPYQSVRRLDRRLQMYGPSGSQMLTRDRPKLSRDSDPDSAGDRQSASFGGSPLTIDWFICWRLPTREFAEASGKRFEESVLRFVQSVGTLTGAQDRLRERIDAMLKAKVGQMSLSEFVSLDAKEIKLEQLNRDLTDQIRSDALNQFGIEVVDLRIKRFNHPEGVKPAIFNMISAERQGVAERYRAEGKSEAAKIRSLADTERSQILSKALADAERIRGEGDAEAMRIANDAHREDPQFYQLLKTLDTYRAILNEKTTIVLSADSPLLKLLTAGVPQPVTPPPSASNSPVSEPQLEPASAGSGPHEGHP